MKRLGNPPPGIQASGSHCAVRRVVGSRRTVLGGKGSLRRGQPRRALASCAPFRMRIIRDGRLPGTKCSAVSLSCETRKLPIESLQVEGSHNYRL